MATLNVAFQTTIWSVVAQAITASWHDLLDSEYTHLVMLNMCALTHYCATNITNTLLLFLMYKYA